MRLNLNSLSQNLFDFLFPTNCLGCGKPGRFVCPQCLLKIKAPAQHCIVCDKASKNGLTHPACLNPQTPSQLLCASDFHDPLPRQIIHSFKYELIKDLGLPCAQVMSEFLKAKHMYFGLEWKITYVPMHPHREYIRGFNQAKLIAQWLSDLLGLELIDSLQKIKQTRSQTKLGYEERIKNLQNVFKANSPLQGQKLILLDDVCTTASTFKECAKTLRLAGAKEVLCLAFARD